jgi:hypothetical protein
MKNNKTILVVGDLIAIALVTVIGFATHGETGISFLPRMAASFFPVLVSWFLLAPWFGLLDEPITSNSKLLWRIPLVMLFAAPLAVILRAVILGSAALPLFTLILGTTSAFGMLIWRALYLFLQKKTA